MELLGSKNAPRRELCYNQEKSTKLDKIENLHSADSIDTESLSTRGRSVWVHSSQVRLLESSVPHNSLPERVGPPGTGVARKLGAEPRYPVQI